LSIFLVPSQSSSTPLYPLSAASQRACPNSLFFCCFHLRLTFESIKELGSASRWVRFEYPLSYILFGVKNDIYLFVKIKNPCFEILKTNFKDQISCQNAKIKIFDSFTMIKIKMLVNEPLRYYK
jgi:hypothetical protein